MKTKMKTKKQKLTKGINGSTGKRKKKDKAILLEEKHIMPCQQKQCGLLNNGCPVCSECGAMPNMTNERCETCFDCECKPGATRDGRDNVIVNEEKIRDMFKNIRMREPPKIRRVLMANGEIHNETENDNSNNIEDDFEKELKAEIIKQMATEFLNKTKEGLEKDNFKNKSEMEEGKENRKKKDLPYIG